MGALVNHIFCRKCISGSDNALKSLIVGQLYICYISNKMIKSSVVPLCFLSLYQYHSLEKIRITTCIISICVMRLLTLANYEKITPFPVLSN